jgi:cytochrome c oxidase assembly protein subunit 11
VPLYRIFCQVTGFAGTTQRADTMPDQVLDRSIKVRFDANVAKSMPWKFHPVQNEVDVKIGESTLAFYEAENLSGKPVRGTATFNVTPEAAGYYFNKIECFCFTEQILKPGQRVDMPVNFFIDPEIAKDPDARKITEITLSYTFFPVKDGPDVASTDKAAGRDGSRTE